MFAALKRLRLVRALRLRRKLRRLDQILDRLVFPEALFGIAPSTSVQRRIDRNNRCYLRVLDARHRGPLLGRSSCLESK